MESGGHWLGPNPNRAGVGGLLGLPGTLSPAHKIPWEGQRTWDQIAWVQVQALERTQCLAWPPSPHQSAGLDHWVHLSPKAIVPYMGILGVEPSARVKVWAQKYP